VIVPLLRPWEWCFRLGPIMAEETGALARLLWSHRSTLGAVTRVELRKRYAGSLLGMLWFPLYSAIFLAMYAFVYVLVFRGRMGALTPFQLVLFIFSGLIPYLGFSEALAASTTSVRANINLVKNTLFPAELVPMKQVLAAFGGMLISLAILVILVILTPFRGWHLLYLPVPLVILLGFCLGAAWILAALAALLPDIVPLINLMLILLLFLSPIGYSLDQVGGLTSVVLYANPMTYLIESFRFALLGMRRLPFSLDAAAFLMSLLIAACGGAFFRRLKPILVDYE
jgi:lipopolysaccharide transport system permease protein